MDLGPRWPAPAVALALVLGAGGTFLPAPASAAPPALHLALDDEGDGEDDEGEERVTRRTPPREDTAGRPPKAAGDEDEVEGIPGLEARDPGPQDPGPGLSGSATQGSATQGSATQGSGDDVARSARERADLRVEETALSAGEHVNALVLLAILGTGGLVGGAFWLSRRFGPSL